MNIPKFCSPSRSWTLPLFGIILAFGFSAILAAFFPNNVRVDLNLWFGADIKSVIRRMTAPDLLGRLQVHPLFGLIIRPIARPLYFLARLAGFEKYLAMGIASQLVTSISAGVTWLLMYGISINLGLKRIQSFLIGAFFLSSSAFMFWWSSPESFPVGSPTILIPFLLLSLGIKSYRLWLLSLVASISITITNFSAGLIASYTQFGFRRLLISLCGLALLITFALSIVQKSYINTAGHPFQIRKERAFINFDNPPAEMFYQFFVAPILPLSPPTLVRQGFNVNRDQSRRLDANENKLKQLHFDVPRLSNIHPLSLLAAITWVLLLLNGVYTALLKRNKTCIALIVFIAFQFSLHFIYGDSPFLYSAHYTPSLILVAGYGLTRDISKAGRDFLKTLGLTLIIFLFFHNIAILNKSFAIGKLYMVEICTHRAESLNRLHSEACRLTNADNFKI